MNLYEKNFKLAHFVEEEKCLNLLRVESGLFRLLILREEKRHKSSEWDNLSEEETNAKIVILLSIEILGMAG